MFVPPTKPAKIGNRLPAQFTISAAEELRTLGGGQIVRPTLSALAILPGREFAGNELGIPAKVQERKGSTSRTIVNSREDKLDSAMWRQAFRQGKCLIPSFAFYDWLENSGGMTVGSRSRGSGRKTQPGFVS
jgi:putative SOS response-associated peptidase YedK